MATAASQRQPDEKHGIAKNSKSTSLIAQRLGAAAALALFVWMAIAWVHTGRTVIRFYSPLPFWDYWDTVKQISHYRHFDLSVYWQQHNEHRIVFPEIIFAADYILFRGREILPTVLNVAFYVATWLILCGVLYRTAVPRLARICAALLAGIVMGWEGSICVISAPFLIQWTLMLVSAALALFLLARARDSRHAAACLAGAIFCCVVCNYSSANGILLWPVVLLAGYIRGLRRIQLMTLAASAAVSIGVYFIGYRFSSDTNIGAMLRHPFATTGFTAAYLGMPFTVVKPWLGVSAGLFGIAAYIAFAVLAFRKRLLGRTAGVVLLGFYLVCFLTALLTAAGRMNPQDVTFGAATAQRYCIIPFAAQAALILAAAWLLGTSRLHLWIPFLGLFVAGFALIGKSPRIDYWIDSAKDSLANCQLASLGFETGVDDAGLMRDVYPGPNEVRLALPILREQKLSTFANARTEWLGKPALQVFRSISERPEVGAVTAVYPLQSGLMVLGWSDSPRRIWKPQELVFLNEEKRIVGLGSKLPAGVPRGLGSLDTPGSLAWAGFVNLRFRSESVSAYVVEAHGKALSPLGKPIVPPAVRLVGPDEIGAPLTSVRWNVQGAWSKGGQVPSAPPDIPPGASYYESWNGGDHNTGELISDPFRKPAGNCLVITGAHGPGMDGLSIQAINAANGDVIGSVPLVGGDVVWRFWRIDVPNDAERVQIVADDHGRGWGEWLMVGEPRACK